MAWLGVAVVFLGGVMLHRHQLGDAWLQVRSISHPAMALLAVVFVLQRLVQAAFMACTVEGLSLRRALLAHEAHTGCSNATIGGAAIGTGVKAAMLRSWQVEPPAIAASISATALISTVTMWAVAAGFAVPMVIQGNAGPGETATAAVGSAVLVGPLVLWWSVLRSPRLVGAVGRRIASLQARARSRSACPAPARSPVGRATWGRSMVARLATLDIAAEAERLRRVASRLVARRWLSLLVASLAGQMALALVLVGALRALGVPAETVSTFDVIRAFALARVLGALSPLPGGVGFLDAGLAASLIRIGVPGSTALAAITLFRALTFIVPLVTGAAAVTFWRRAERRVVVLPLAPISVQVEVAVPDPPRLRGGPVLWRFRPESLT